MMLGKKGVSLDAHPHEQIAAGRQFSVAVTRASCCEDGGTDCGRLRSGSNAVRCNVCVSLLLHHTCLQSGLTLMAAGGWRRHRSGSDAEHDAGDVGVLDTSAGWALLDSQQEVLEAGEWGRGEWGRGVVTWGNNTFGQLGRESVADVDPVPAHVALVPGAQVLCCPYA